MRGYNHPLNLGAELLQSLNKTEELRDCNSISSPFVEEVQCHKGKGDQVAKRLICRRDGSQADLSVCLQGIHGGQTSIQLLCQEGGFRPPEG